jgi:hypothetical protein
VKAYAVSQVVLGGLLCAVGLLLVVKTLVAGGGPLALGLVVGVGFAIVGAARVWIATRGGRAETEQ